MWTVTGLSLMSDEDEVDGLVAGARLGAFAGQPELCRSPAPLAPTRRCRSSPSAITPVPTTAIDDRDDERDDQHAMVRHVGSPALEALTVDPGPRRDRHTRALARGPSFGAVLSSGGSRLTGQPVSNLRLRGVLRHAGPSLTSVT